MSNSTCLEARAAASAPAVVLRDVRKVYGRGEGAVAALDGVSAAWLAAILGVSALLALVALSVPTRQALRSRPVEAIGTRE
jgi:hypothetical protein